MRRTGDHMRDRLGSGVVVLGSVVVERPVIIVMATSDIARQGGSRRKHRQRHQPPPSAAVGADVPMPRRPVPATRLASTKR